MAALSGGPPDMAAGAAAAPLAYAAARKPRLHYIDWLRSLAISLVVCVHVVTLYFYGTAVAMYLSIFFPIPEGFATIVAWFFLRVTQGYFMGLMFLLSGYFTAPSFRRKGAARFLADRLLRLGLPTVVFMLGLQPLAHVIGRAAGPEHTLPGLAEAKNAYVWYIYALVTSSEIIGGPVWFIFLLLVFDVCYGITAACCCAAGRRRRRGAAVAAGPADGASAADSRGAGGGGAGGGADTCVDIRPGYALPKFELSASAGPATAAYSTRSTRAAPTSALAEAEPYSVGRALAGMAAAAAVLYSLCFAIRIPCPPGYWTPFVQINIGYLPQYIFCYIFGIWAQRSGALARLPACLWPWCLAVGGLWAAGGWVANLWVAEFDWGVVMSASGSLGYNAFFSVYEQVFAVVWSVGLLVFAREHMNRRGGRVGAAITGASYCMYLIHGLFITSYGLAFMRVPWPAAAKAAVVAPLAIVSSWIAATIIKAIPGVSRVL